MTEEQLKYHKSNGQFKKGGIETRGLSLLLEQ